MIKRPLFLSVLVLAVAAGLVVLVYPRVSGQGVIARCKGIQITQSQFVKRLKGLSPEIQKNALQRRAEFVEEMIDERLLTQEALRKGLDRDPEVKDLLEQSRSRILIAKLLEPELKKITVTAEEAAKVYEANKDKLKTPEMFRISHILVKTKAEAEAIKQQLVFGADFEQLARDKSIHRSSVGGGDIGFFTAGKLIPEIEQAALRLQKGQISDPVESKFGYHIIKLTDKAESSVPDFDMVKADIEKLVLNDRRTKLLKEVTAKLRGDAKSHIDPRKLEAVSV